MYVTTDVVVPQAFNERSLNVLAVIDPRNPKITHPLFLPVNKNFIDSIDIQLIDPHGNAVQFVSGLPKFVLCFDT